MGLNASCKLDLLKAITTNWWWVIKSTKIVDATFLEENFTEEELNEAGVYTSKTHRTSAAAFACGSATVKAYDSATVKANSNSYVEDCTGKLKTPDDFSIIKDYYNHKIYIKKGKFEIIEVD